MMASLDLKKTTILGRISVKENIFEKENAERNAKIMDGGEKNA